MDFISLNEIIFAATNKDVAVRYEDIDGNQSAVGECWISRRFKNLLFVNADNDKGGVYINFKNISDIRILPTNY